MKGCVIKGIVKFLLIFNFVLKINANNFKIKRANDKVISKLLDIIKYNDVDKYASTDNEFEQINSNFKYKNAKYATTFENHDFKRGFNTILIKRLVPHGYKTNVYEYDEKYKTLFRPLVRIHTNGDNRILVNNAIIKDNEVMNKKAYRYDNFDTENKNAIVQYLLQPFKVNKAAKIKPQSILDTVKRYVRSENDVKKIRALKYALWDILENKPDVLRSVLYIPPGEISARPDKDDIIMPDSAAPWGSQYSYWNYWTYNKPVYEDHCKGRLVQWGNMCIETPPH